MLFFCSLQLHNYITLRKKKGQCLTNGLSRPNMGWSYFSLWPSLLLLFPFLTYFQHNWFPYSSSLKLAYFHTCAIFLCHPYSSVTVNLFSTPTWLQNILLDGRDSILFSKLSYTGAKIAYVISNFAIKY